MNMWKRYHSLDKLVEDVSDALKLTEEKANNEQDKDKKETLQNIKEKTNKMLTKLKNYY